MAEPESTNSDSAKPVDDLAQAALKAAQDAIASLQGDVNDVAAAASPAAPAPAAAPTVEETGAAPFELPVFAGTSDVTPPKGIDLLSDVNLNVKIELGRTRMLVEDVLKLAEGAIVELEKLAGDPVDIFVNDRPIARGEVLVLNDNFCVRINEILQPGADDRLVG
jgi:flagellar motor switch protein FliN/FliY